MGRYSLGGGVNYDFSIVDPHRYPLMGRQTDWCGLQPKNIVVEILWILCVDLCKKSPKFLAAVCTQTEDSKMILTKTFGKKHIPSSDP